MGFDKFQWTSNNSPQPAAGVPPQYKFLPPTAAGSYLNIKLDGMGPKLLVSDMSTADQPVLRWRLVVRGNTAVEFGVVPLNMVVSAQLLDSPSTQPRAMGSAIWVQRADSAHGCSGLARAEKDSQGSMHEWLL